jgi:hypothetical protein
MIRFNPFTSYLTKNIRNIQEIKNILRQYDYNNSIRRTPIIYLTEFNEIDNYYAIENVIRDQLVKKFRYEVSIKGNTLPTLSGVRDSSIDIKYYLRRHKPEFVLKEDRQTYYLENKNCTLIRLWYERKLEKTEVNVLMEKGSFNHSYVISINHEHTFEEAKNNDNCSF